MINKVVKNVEEALKGVESGMEFMLGGFGLCGIPENSIAHLRDRVCGWCSSASSEPVGSAN